MAIQDVIPKLMQWSTGTQALAALGAELAALQPGVEAAPEIRAALQAVSTAAGLGDLGELAPQEQQMMLGIIRLTLHQALDLLDNPAAQPGWNYTDPVILEGYGRASMSIPPLIARSHPDLANVTSFLDVGTGVGLLAVAATDVWADATVVGIDPWETSLARARANVDQAGKAERITLRQTDLASITDEAAFDCVWIPTFFLTEATLEAGLVAAVRALRPGGWVVLGRSAGSPDPLGNATGRLMNLRGGGTSLDPKRAVDLLEAAGCVDVHVAAPAGPAPIELILGKGPDANEPVARSALGPDYGFAIPQPPAGKI